MNQTPATLELRDIHLPDAISWWPLASGWWIVIAVSLTFILLMFFVYGWYQHRALYRSACQQLNHIEQAFNDSQDKIQLVKSISVLLRRISISFYDRETLASLTGEKWLAYLDESLVNTACSDAFSSGVGKVLIEAPYNPHCEIQHKDILELTRLWLKKNTRRRKQRDSF